MIKMSFKKIDINEIVLNPFKTIGKDWLLISASKEDKINTMTASWGGIGVIWNKNVVTVYIRPQRYTREFVDASDYFTLTFFEGYKKELGILGSKSGRDGDSRKAGRLYLQRVQPVDQTKYCRLSRKRQGLAPNSQLASPPNRTLPNVTGFISRNK